jgi:hypothetical protein
LQITYWVVLAGLSFIGHGTPCHDKNKKESVRLEFSLNLEMKGGHGGPPLRFRNRLEILHHETPQVGGQRRGDGHAFGGEGVVELDAEGVQPQA